MSLDAPFRIAFDNARDPLTARNALGITSLISSATAPLSITDGVISVDPAYAAYNCGRLKYVSATALSFNPYNGDRIKINSAVYAIPSAGIAGLANTGVFVGGVAAQNLAASTVYNVYAFNNGGTITADFSTATHAMATAAGNVGTECKSGDETRTLIGKVFTNASAQFRDDAAFRGVISWFNRRNRALYGSASGATASTTLIAFTSAAAEFITWAEDDFLINATAFGVNNTANDGVQVSVGVDGVAIGQPGLAQCYVGNAYLNLGASISSAVSEGYHYIVPMVAAFIGGAATSVIASNNSILRG